MCFIGIGNYYAEKKVIDGLFLSLIDNTSVPTAIFSWEFKPLSPASSRPSGC